MWLNYDFLSFQVSLIYANVSPDDILLKKKLDMLAATHPNFKVPNFQNECMIPVSVYHVKGLFFHEKIPDILHCR